MRARTFLTVYFNNFNLASEILKLSQKRAFKTLYYALTPFELLRKPVFNKLFNFSIYYFSVLPSRQVFRLPRIIVKISVDTLTLIRLIKVNIL